MKGSRASMSYCKEHKPLIDNASSRDKAVFLKWRTATLVWRSNGKYGAQGEEHVDIASPEGKTSKILLGLGNRKLLIC